jgi:hypothetical protein
MPIPAYELYRPYEEDKFKTSTQKKVEQALEEAREGGTPEVRELLVELEEAREVLGKDFLGPEAIQKTLEVELDPEELEAISHIPFSRAELEKAKELGMMLVLRVPRTRDGKPLTINAMREMFAKGDTLADPKKKKRQLFYRNKGEAWYDNEEFATKPTTQIGWGLVGKSVLSESTSKTWDEQETLLKKWAEQNGLDPTTVRRRTPVEVAYDTLVYYGQNQESLLEDRYDWTSVQSSYGGPVCVGCFGSLGLGVDDDSRGDRGAGLGVCPSR